MHYAVRSASKEIIQLLLKSGANPNLQTNGGKSTALHRACLYGRPDIVHILIGRFKDLEASIQGIRTQIVKMKK